MQAAHIRPVFFHTKKKLPHLEKVLPAAAPNQTSSLFLFFGCDRRNYDFFSGYFCFSFDDVLDLRALCVCNVSHIQYNVCGIFRNRYYHVRKSFCL